MSPLEKFLPVQSRIVLVVLFAALAAAPARGDLLNRWSFNNSAGTASAGTTLTDSVSGKVGVVRGVGATFTGTQLLLPGTTNGNQTPSSISAYLDLPNGLISNKTNLTIEFWADTKSVKNWQRFFDFGRVVQAGDGLGAAGEITGTATTAPGTTQASDELFLASQRGTTANTQRLASRIDFNGTTGTEFTFDSGLTTTAGTTYHYVVVFQDSAGSYGTSGGTISWYRNGTFIGSVDVNYHLSSIEDVNDWLGRSQWSGDSNANIAYDEFRIYDNAFTATDVANSFSAGPNPTYAPPVTQPDSVTMHYGQKARIAVLANDSGTLAAATVAVVQAPQFGTAVADGTGKILYTHTTGAPATDTFTYRVGGAGGTSAATTVTVNFTNNLRIANNTLNVPSSPPATAFQLNPAFDGVAAFSQPLCMASPPGDTKRLFVCEKTGVLKMIPDVTATTGTQSTFLDLPTLLTARGEAISTTSEQGLLGLAFHPNYATNGFFYVYYSVTASGTTYERVSRFTVSAGNPNAANTASEVTLFQQPDSASNHNGGDLHFGPDGYLYISLGDGGDQNDSQGHAQRINDGFYSGIARIDVDKKSGSLAPNLHSQVPLYSGTAAYAIPPNNPYIGATSFNGAAVTASSVFTELYAVGLRNPWRFSFDSQTGEMWCGNVGQDAYEGVYTITSGQNCGWSFYEQNHNGPKIGSLPSGFTYTHPVYEYAHGSGNFQGNSVIGGLVYRGTRFPSLAGQYIFADYVSGNIWTLVRNGASAPTVTRITGQGGIVALGTDPSNGDVLMANINTGIIQRLVTSTVAGSFPTTLSATGLFADLTDLSPSPGVLPYAPNLAFWSDYAIKRRWFVIPDGASKMSWSRDGQWTFPDGQIWVKHFDLDMTRGDDSTKKRIETRLLVKNSTGAYGVSYRWNDAQTEATLVPDEGASFPLTINVSGSNYTQTWQIPSRASCLICHTPQAGHALSFNTRQMNQSNTMDGFSGNQIDLLRTGGYFSNTPESTNLLPRHLRANETAYPAEARVRSYLAVNCSYCHQAGGTASPAAWDGRPQLTLDQTGLINGTASNNGGNAANKLVVPGDTLHSIVFNRVSASNGFTRMPPLASSELDQADIALLQEWIAQSLPNRQTYDQWRVAQFGSSTSSQGDPAADPDSDSRTNTAEFLALTNPLDGSSFLAPQVSTNGSNVTFSFAAPANRSAFVDTSSDLINWSLWDVPGNNGIPLPGGNVMLTGPMLGTKQFFRLRLQEN